MGKTNRNRKDLLERRVKREIKQGKHTLARLTNVSRQKHKEAVEIMGIEKTGSKADSTQSRVTD